MKKIIYTRTDDEISIVIPVEQTAIEKFTGVLSLEDYEQHVRDRSIPDNSINVREIEDVDIPTTREFRNAWEDTQVGTQIDINCSKARDIKLSEMREKRVELLENQDKLSLIAMEAGDDLTAIKAEKQRLRDITNSIKALSVIGKYNDDVLLQSIRDLSIM